MLIKGYHFSPTLIPTLATLLVCSVLVTLGFWQLDRAEEKRKIESDLRLAQEQQLINLNKADPDRLLEKAYYATQLKGHYDNKRQFLYDNRTYKGKPGYHVLTPFYLDGRDTAVLVNRGWIPYTGTRENIPDISVTEAAVTVKGMIKEPSQSIVLNKAESLSSGFPITLQHISLTVLSVKLNTVLLPVVIELDKAEQSGFVRDWQPYYGKIDKHIAYAVQWFFMAAVLFLLFLKMNTKKTDGLGAV